MPRTTLADPPSQPTARPDAAARSPRGYFSERERQVLQLLQSGLGTDEICARLGVNHRALRFVHDRLKAKLGCGDLGELRQITARRALVDHVAAVSAPARPPAPRA